MNFLDYLKDQLHIDPIIALIVLAAGFFQSSYLPHWNLVKDEKWASGLRTLIVSAVVSVIYLWLSGVQRDAFANYFISYFMATSFYEMLIRPFTKWLQKKIGGDDNNGIGPSAPKDAELKNLRGED